MEIPLSSGFYVDESTNISNQDCLNLYPVVIQTKSALNTTALRSPAGITTFVEEDDSGPTRGAIRLDNELYVVQGESFFKIDSNGVKSIPAAQTVVGTNRVAMSENGKVITVIVPGTDKGYFYDKDLDTFAEITDLVFIDYGIKIDVTHKDGYFIYLTAKEFFLSSLVVENNGKNFDGLDFSTAEVNTDDNVGIEVIRNELHVFGQKSVEVFQNTGGVFPFQRIPGGAIDRGLVSSFSVLAFQNSYVFIGGGESEGLSIWMGMSGQSQVISTPPIDNILQSLPIVDLQNAFTFKYSEGGNFFVVFTVPNQITLIYDETTSRLTGTPTWHRRATNISGDGDWRVNEIVQVYGKILCFDANDSRIGELNINVFTDYEDTVLRRFNTGYIQTSGGRFRVPLLELKTQIGASGIGINVVDDPSVTMRQSFDGVNFTNPLLRSLADTPSGITRAIWYNLGLYEYSFAMQFDITTDKKLAITKLVADIV